MPSWKKVITSGSNAAFNSLTVSSTITGSISGSLTGSLSGSTTVGNNLITLPNPSAITYLRVNENNTVTPRTPAEVLTDLGVMGTIKIAKDATTHSVSNTTANTVIVSYAIPANTLQVDDFIRFETFLDTTVTNLQGTITFQVYLNTSPSIGVTSLSSWVNNTGQWRGLFQRLFMVTAIGTNGNLRYQSSGQISNYVSNNTFAANVTIDTTVTQYFVLAIQMPVNTATTSTQGTLITITR
jgi:hypothetical protein